MNRQSRAAGQPRATVVRGSSPATRWSGALATAALVLAACGGGEEAAEEPPPPAPEEELTVEAEPEPDPEPEAPEPEEVAEEPEIAGDVELLWSIDLAEDRRRNVEVVVAHPDGELLLAGSDATYVVHAADGYLADAIVYWYPSVDDLAVSPDGTLVGAGLGLRGTPLTTLEGALPPGLEDFESNPDFAGASFHGGFDNNLSFAPDGERLATGNRDGEVWIWDLQTGEQLATLSVGDPSMQSRMLSFIAYHPSGSLLATVNFTCRVDVWDLDAEEVVHEIELDLISCYKDRPLAFSSDGQLLATAIREDGTQFARIWTVDGFEPVLDLEMDVRNFADLAFSPDDQLLATAAWRMPPSVWDVETGALLYSLDTGIDPDEGEDGEGWYHPHSITFTPDGGHVAVGYQNGTLELWQLPGAEPLEAPEREDCEPLPLPGDILFDTGSAQLRAEADAALTDLAAQLAERFDVATLTFIGHTDSRGDAAANQQLSEERATAVRDWLEGWASDGGITGWTLEVDGRGASELQVPDVDANGDFVPAAGSINRRVEIEIDADACR